MPEVLDYLFGAASFMPHGVCLLWRPDLVALHAISDFLIAAAYLAIPIAIAIFLKRRPDLDDRARLIAGLFALFIVACAVTHLAALATLWVPAYGLQGLLKAVTAVVSVMTAIVVWRVVPELVALPSPAQLHEANEALAAANRELEDKVAARTFEVRQIHQRLQEALTGSNITVFTQDRDLKYTWIHHPRLGYSVEETIGKTDHEMLPPDVAEITTAAKEDVLETGQPKTLQVTIPSEKEGTLIVDLKIVPTTDGYGSRDGVLCTAIDQTEQKMFETRLAALAAQMADTNRRFELALKGSSITVFEQDRDLRYTYLYNPPQAAADLSPIGRSDYDIFDAEVQRKLIEAKEAVLTTGQRQRLEVTVPLPDGEHFVDLTLEPIFDEDEQTTGLIGTSVDLTNRRELENRLRLMMREMTHRSKNLLAVIQSMARQTASGADDLDAFVTSFSARLQAMAASQDLLVSTAWTGADLEDLIRSQLSQGIDPSSAQVALKGPKLKITAQTAQDLGLSLHELTTNAAKYGALSTREGKITVTWAVEDDGMVRIRWRESGGPKVAPPTRKGFGSLLLSRIVGQSLGGAVEVDYAEEGVECDISFPVEKLVRQSPAPAG